MEHREPPRAIVEDPASRSVAAASPRRLEGPRPEPRRFELDRRRAGIAVTVSIIVLVGLYLAERAGSVARRWLADQPAYQLEFRAIELEPRPPSWYRGGATGFLDEVRRRSRMPERIPLLGLEAKELEAAFKQYPWTEAVTRTTFPPLGVTIHLAYRRPVAIVKTSDGQPYLVDRSAIVLPVEDLDVDLETFAKEQGLIRIQGRGLAPPWNPRPGLPWLSPPGLADLSQEKERIKAAASMASFLRQKSQSIDTRKEPALDFMINPVDRRGLFLWNAESTYILWGQAPGEESEEAPGAEEKWEMLREWSRSEKQRVVPVGDYWEITKRGVVHMYQPPAPEAARVLPAVEDVSAVRAKASGNRP